MRRLSIAMCVLVLSSGCRHREADSDWNSEPRSGCLPEAYETVDASRPSLIGWDADESRGLGRRMRDDSVVVVAYDGPELRVLEDCRVGTPSQYAYQSLAESEEDSTELRGASRGATMPLAGDLATQEPGFHLTRSKIGIWYATGMVLGRELLEGDCDDATHVVTKAEVGSYELTRADAAASENPVVARGGVVRACTPSAEQPPEGCDTLLSLELEPLTSGRRISLSRMPLPLEPGPDPEAMTDEERMEYAKRLYVEGDEAFRQGQYDIALVKFQTAYRRYVPSLHVFNFNIGQAAHDLGDCATAKTAFQRFLDLVPDHDLRERAMQRLLEIERSGCANVVR